MESAGEDFLPGTGFSSNKHGCGRRSYLLDQPHDFLHRFSRADKFADATCFPQLPPQGGHLLPIAGFPQSAIEKGPQHRSFEGLFDVPEGASLNRGNSTLLTTLSGDDYGWNGSQLLTEPLKKA